MANRIGIDLGGTKIEAIIIDDQFQVIDRKRIPTLRDEGYDAIINRIIDLSKEMISIGDIDGPIASVLLVLLRQQRDYSKIVTQFV